MLRSTAVPLLLLGTIHAGTLAAQQGVDTTFRPRVDAPAYAAGTGPRVLVDEAHNNARSIDGEYRPFADLLRLDGYRVAPATAPRFTRDALASAQILVIINALADGNVGHWALPTPSAFDPDEIEAVTDWVRGGGALLLVADHMPFPGASEDLARAFGIEFTNGFAIDTVAWNALVFRRADGTLPAHPIREGRHAGERVDSVATFWGQAFRATDAATRALLTFPPGVVSLLPDSAWRFSERTPTEPVGGWSQGVALTFGAGRVVVLGEAGMLSAQVSGPNRVPMGMNHRWARQNAQFTLNVFHWLSGLLPVEEP